MWESQREESKQVRINDTEAGFLFPLFSEAALLKNAINAIRGKKKAHLQGDDQMMTVRKKRSHKFTSSQAAGAHHAKLCTSMYSHGCDRERSFPSSYYNNYNVCTASAALSRVFHFKVFYVVVWICKSLPTFYSSHLKLRLFLFFFLLRRE